MCLINIYRYDRYCITKFHKYIVLGKVAFLNNPQSARGHIVKVKS